MDTPRRSGLVIGLLLILYMVGSGIVDFLLGAPLLLAATLGILTEALWVAIAVTAHPIIRPESRTLADLFVALGALILAVGIFENLAKLPLGWGVPPSAAGSAHLLVRMVHGAAMFLFYLALLRLRAVPRLLAGAGVIASLLQVGALAAPFFGGTVLFPLLAPTGVCQLILATWLIAKGLDLHPGAAAT